MQGRSRRPAKSVLTLMAALSIIAGLATSGLAGGARAASAQSDGDAAALAKQVRAGGPGALPALRAAMAQAGFGVRDADGALPPVADAPSQGIAFDAWELEAILALMQAGFSAPLADTGAAVSASVPELEDAPVAQFLLNGVQANAAGGSPALRFWALFIAEMGIQAPEPSDLLTATDPAAVQLDAVQFGFILRRLSGDLHAFGLDQSDALAPAGTAPSGVASALPRTGDAITAKVAGASLQAQAAQTLPCSLGSTEGLVMDGAALGAGVGFGELMTYLEDQGMKSAAKIGKVTGAANLVLAYVKLAWTLGAFKADISLDQPGPPLTRTKKPRPQTGERRELQAKLRMDIGHPQLVNCFRPMLNGAGLDFSLPTDGAISGADVEWVVIEGGTRELGLDAIVQFYGGDPRHRQTSAQGVSTMGIEGTGQRRELSEHATPVEKKARVRANTALKPANIVQDLVDASGAAYGGGLGILGMPPEMLYRGKWALSYDYTFPVRDWEDRRWLVEGTVLDDRVGTDDDGHDPLGYTTVQGTFKAEVHYRAAPESYPDFATLEPDVQKYVKAMYAEGWNLSGEGVGHLSIASYDSHPGTTYNCSASANGPAKVTVFGKLKEGKAYLAVVMISDTDLEICLPHTTAPNRGKIPVGMQVDFSPDGAFRAKDADLLQIELKDGTTGRVQYPGRESGPSVRHLITWEGHVTDLNE